jgi:hypothetical protein
MEFSLGDSERRLTLAAPYSSKDQLVSLSVSSDAEGPHLIDGFGAVPPGAIRIFKSDGMRWRRCYLREVIARTTRLLSSRR